MPVSSGKSLPLHLILEDSRWMRRGLITLHGLAVLATLANPLPYPIQWLLILAIVASLAHYRHRKNPVLGLTLNPPDEWEIIHRDGPLQGQLLPDTLVTRWMVILGFETSRGKLYLPIPRDSVDPEPFRRLRVHLRTTGGIPSKGT